MMNLESRPLTEVLGYPSKCRQQTSCRLPGMLGPRRVKALVEHIGRYGPIWSRGTTGPPRLFLSATSVHSNVATWALMTSSLYNLEVGHPSYLRRKSFEGIIGTGKILEPCFWRCHLTYVISDFTSAETRALEDSVDTLAAAINPSSSRGRLRGPSYVWPMTFRM